MNKSTAMLCGTTVKNNQKSQSGNNQRNARAFVTSARPTSKETAVTRRRAQSSYLQGRNKFQAGATLHKRGSNLFKQTVEGTQII